MYGMEYDDYNPDYDEYDHDSDEAYSAFANPGSALRAETRDNPRNLSCPTCQTPNVLTPADQARGYQCDACATQAEGGYVYGREY